jgi:hypothetical protein
VVLPGAGVGGVGVPGVLPGVGAGGVGVPGVEGVSPGGGNRLQRAGSTNLSSAIAAFCSAQGGAMTGPTTLLPGRAVERPDTAPWPARLCTIAYVARSRPEKFDCVRAAGASVEVSAWPRRAGETPAEIMATTAPSATKRVTPRAILKVPLPQHATAVRLLRLRYCPIPACGATRPARCSRRFVEHLVDFAPVLRRLP